MSVDPFALPRFGCVKVKYHDRAYLLRLEELTLKNVSKILKLILNTILLVSTDERGRFSDVDDMGSDEWTVEGTESSNRSSGSAFPPRVLLEDLVPAGVHKKKERSSVHNSCNTNYVCRRDWTHIAKTD